MNSTEIKEMKSLLLQPKKIVIIPHKNPDGDAIGSTLALCNYLRSKKHDAVVVAPNDFPDFLKWVPGQENLMIFDQQVETSKNKIEEAELIFTLDFNHFSRTGQAMEAVLKDTLFL